MKIKGNNDIFLHVAEEKKSEIKVSFRHYHNCESNNLDNCCIYFLGTSQFSKNFKTPRLQTSTE